MSCNATINQAIAESLGYRFIGSPEHAKLTKGFTIPEAQAVNPEGELCSPHSVPNYCGDLNAMHQVEDTFYQDANLRVDYVIYLEDDLHKAPMTLLIRATALQRAKAYLKIARH